MDVLAYRRPDSHVAPPCRVTWPAGRWPWLLLGGGWAALRLRYMFVLRPDSDEPQHLHVVWGWTQGLLPFRDFFDNHAPLFSWLCSPLMAALGERSDILCRMRGVMLPLAAGCLWCVHRLGAGLFDRRAGNWAAAVTGCCPLFFYLSCEFRPDTLWTLWWLLALTILLTGPPTARRLFAAGLALGLALATSLKTLLLLLTLTLAGALWLAARWPAVRVPPWRTLAGCTASLAAGIALAPGLVAAYFAWRGAWGPFVYGLVIHNALPGLAGTTGWRRWRPLIFLLGAGGGLAGARALLARRGGGADPRRARQVFFLLVAGGYPLLLVSCWPLLTAQDWLPAAPPLALALTAAPFIRGADRPLLRTGLSAALVAAGIAAIFLDHGPWRDRTFKQRRVLAAALRLTAPGDPLLDDKGEMIFRRRPFFYALETITRARLQRGLIPDDIAARLVATHTAVVHAASLPPAAESFVRENYLSAGPMRVLGRALLPLSPLPGQPPAAPGRWGVAVAVPARYVVIDADARRVPGRFDGRTPDPAGDWLEAGPHEYSTPAAPGNLTLFWANAWEKGFRPAPPNG